MALASVWFWLAGNALDPGLAGERLVAYLPTLLFVAALGGGNEEPGWRGFALPRLQERLSPLAATLVVGAAWATWHAPILALSENADHGLGAPAFAGLIALMWVGIALGYNVMLAYAWNRTRAVLPCVLLHASYNTALGLVILRAEEDLQGGTHALLTAVVTATFVAAAAALVWATRGRLGSHAPIVPR